MSKQVYIDAAGCNRRQLDLERIRAYLELNGYALVTKPEDADRIIVATCAFKKKEEDDSVARLEALSKYAGKTVVFGCLPDIAPKRFEQFEGMPTVAPKELDRIEEYFAAAGQSFGEVADSHILPRGAMLSDWKVLRRNLAAAFRGNSLPARQIFHQALVAGRHRLNSFGQASPRYYYLLVCRGCLGKCSYCAIRRSIGSVKSKSVALVCDDLRVGIEQGFRDFVILGDDPGCYGVDIGSSIAELLESLDSYCNLLADQGEQDTDRSAPIRLHLKEIHPKFLIVNTGQLLQGRAMSRVSSFLCPIQSGSDRILELMQREHRMDDLHHSLEMLRMKVPDMVLSTQLIIGFPGETDDEFAQSLEAVSSGRFKSVVVFPYDDKEGTAAAELPDKVPQKVINARMRQAFQHFRTTGVQAYYSCPP